jgi:AcrR family transcriptional regulator
MRRIAQALRAGAMSLYWHIASKQHLLDLMVDTLVGDTPVTEPTGDWRADLRAQAIAQRKMMHRHRWVVDFIGGRPPLGPNTILNSERLLGALDVLGLDIHTAMFILETVHTYVLGAVLREARELRGQLDEEQAGVTPAEWQAAMLEWRRRLAADGRITRFLRILDEDFDPDSPETRDERFEFGLDCVLDGIAARLATSGGGRPQRPRPS